MASDSASSHPTANPPPLCPTCGATLQDDGTCPSCTPEGVLEKTWIDSRPPLTDVPAPAPIPAPAPPLPAKLGSFDILREIGRGGMGIVYEGRDPRLDRPVAIKVLPDSVVSCPDARARFDREMKAVARLSHPHIVAAYHAGEDDGVHYLAMEFVPGTDLNVRIKTEGTVAPDIAVDWILQAARGLNRAHEAGIVHRDIKPGNLLVIDSKASAIYVFRRAE